MLNQLRRLSLSDIIDLAEANGFEPVDFDPTNQELEDEPMYDMDGSYYHAPDPEEDDDAELPQHARKMWS